MQCFSNGANFVFTRSDVNKYLQFQLIANRLFQNSSNGCWKRLRSNAVHCLKQNHSQQVSLHYTR